VANLVDTLTDPLLIAGVLAAGACFATIVTIAAPSLAEDKLGSRLKEVAKKREELRKRSRAELAKGVGSLQHKERQLDSPKASSTSSTCKRRSPTIR
jgi:tight adherence protein C